MQIATAASRICANRDRARLLHSSALRRLAAKTQVLSPTTGLDFARNRLTHSLEVAQVGRELADSLGLDPDVVDTACLAHDIGHPPFGHAGEDALHAALHAHGGFDHNAHCLRTLMRLESPYCDHPGLNLSWDVLEGLAKHNGPVAAPNWALAERDAVFPLDLGAWPSLEAQAAAIRVDGKQARVMSTDNEGTPIYRVVLGPFATRAEAERIGRGAGRDYWIFEGLP